MTNYLDLFFTLALFGCFLFQLALFFKSKKSVNGAWAFFLLLTSVSSALKWMADNYGQRSLLLNEIAFYLIFFSGFVFLYLSYKKNKSKPILFVFIAFVGVFCLKIASDLTLVPSEKILTAFGGEKGQKVAEQIIKNSR